MIEEFIEEDDDDVEMTPEQVEAQWRVQVLMHTLLRSAVSMVMTKTAEEVEELLNDDEMGLIVTMSLVKAAAELAVEYEASKDQFISVCEQIYDAISLINTPVAGTA